jgi:putative DNA methylase
MTRMIERWFPCSEVSDASVSGWGSGNAERALFTWFAARPTAQAKAAVITSLLPWPDDEAEQKRLQELVRSAMRGRYNEWVVLSAELLKQNPNGAAVLDPFSGRGMIPLEAARLGLPAYGLDYSPVAVLASELLIDYPFRDWSAEPSLSFANYDTWTQDARLVADVEAILARITERFETEMARYYPAINKTQPFGYLWSVTLPCQECGRRFPLVGSFELRKPSSAKRDAGQAFYIDADNDAGEFRAVVHNGPPQRVPTLAAATRTDGKKVKGKSAVCPFCSHVHPLSVHQRLAGDGMGRDALLVVADPDPDVGRLFRVPTDAEIDVAGEARVAIAAERPFTPLLSAVPDEEIPLNNGATIRPQLYGAKTYGDLSNERQTLGYIKLARTIGELARELTQTEGVSRDYARALCGYAAAAFVRVLKFGTRGAKMRTTPGAGLIDHIFSNESTIAFSYDYFEAGLGDGPGTWKTMSKGTAATLRSLMADHRGRSGKVSRGSAAQLPYPSGSMAVVVTDPPYDAMVYYSDSSDYFFAWLKRALYTTRPEMLITSDRRGVQEKTDEIIVKEHGIAPGEHRTREHYDSRISKAFSEMRRVVADDGLVTIVFGHGEPEVWHRLLGAISGAELVLTGSWPAKTEAGGQQGKANIVTTLTMCCRPAPADRPVGRAAVVEAEVRDEVKARLGQWSRSGLAPTDMLMASAGPAMEVVGRYGEVINNKGVPVAPEHYLLVARRAVKEAEAIEIDHHSLDSFDARTSFALWWARLFRKGVAPKSELRWQALASDMDLADVRDLVPDADKGCRFVSAQDWKGHINDRSPVIDVALAMARAWPDGLDAVGEVFLTSGRDDEDTFLWGAVSFLADRIPDADPDAIAWSGILRARRGVASAARGVSAARQAADLKERYMSAQSVLFGNEEEAE